MDGSFVVFFNEGIIVKKRMFQSIQQSCKWRIDRHFRKDEKIGITVFIHYNTINANILGSTEITITSECTPAKIRITIGTKITLHTLSTESSSPIFRSIEDISGTDEDGRQMKGIGTSNYKETTRRRCWQM